MKSLLLFKGTEQGIGISHAQREGETRAAVRLRHHNLLVLQLPDLLRQRINHRVQQVRDQVWSIPIHLSEVVQHESEET